MSDIIAEILSYLKLGKAINELFTGGISSIFSHLSLWWLLKVYLTFFPPY
jgi:hypothetical protein